MLRSPLYTSLLSLRVENSIFSTSPEVELKLQTSTVWMPALV